MENDELPAIRPESDLLARARQRHREGKQTGAAIRGGLISGLVSGAGVLFYLLGLQGFLDSLLWMAAGAGIATVAALCVFVRATMDGAFRIDRRGNYPSGFSIMGIEMSKQDCFGAIFAFASLGAMLALCFRPEAFAHTSVVERFGAVGVVVFGALVGAALGLYRAGRTPKKGK